MKLTKGEKVATQNFSKYIIELTRFRRLAFPKLYLLIPPLTPYQRFASKLLRLNSRHGSFIGL